MTEHQSETPRTMPKVITVTLNPALDRTLSTHFLALGYHNRTNGTTRLDPAGRGVSVSRALRRLGAPTHAVVLLGYDATGRAYETLLAEEQFPTTILRRAGQTRSITIVVDSGHQNETVIVEEGDGLSWQDRQAVANALVGITEPGDTVVFAGSLPPDVRSDTYALLTSLVQTKGAAVAINAGGGDALKQSIQARPRLIYLVRGELERLFNMPVRVTEDVIACADQLHRGGVRRVLVGIPETDQALLVTEDGSWLAQWPEGAGSYSGCAEALIAGYLAGRLAGKSFQSALALGAAMSAYTASQMGREFGTRKDIEDLADQVTIAALDGPSGT